jgi:hypothetical protein
VGNDDAASVMHEVVHGLLDNGFGFSVQGAGGLVQDKQGRIFEDSSGDGDASLLAPLGEFRKRRQLP